MLRGLLNKPQRELEIRNFSKRTIKSYIYFISKFLEYAENKGLNKLAMKISDGHDNLLDQAVRWKNFIDEEVSLEDRIDIAGFEEMVVSMIRKRVKVENRFPKPVHEEPVLLLVVNEAGISTFSRVFSEIDQNYQLISGFLSAINSVLHDIFSVPTLHTTPVRFSHLLQHLSYQCNDFHLHQRILLGYHNSNILPAVALN